MLMVMKADNFCNWNTKEKFMCIMLTVVKPDR